MADLCGQLGYPALPEQVTKRLEELWQRLDQAVFVAEVEGHVAGWVHVYACPTIESEPYAEIGGLVVDETQRDIGVGKALMAKIEEWSRRGGFSEVRLRTNMFRKDAHQFYKAIGYENFKTQLTFRKFL